MSAPAPQGEPKGPDTGRPGRAEDAEQDSLLLGLQLCRANTMSLTRLQLALRSGDRQCALEAIDRLHALDARIEHLVRRLPPPANETTDWKAITQHLEDQKIAIAFEKLALASEISGPKMVSQMTDEYQYDPEEPHSSWPFALAPQPRRPFDPRLITGVLIGLLVLIVLSSVAIVVIAL